MSNNNVSGRCYTFEELSEILESFNINRGKFGEQELGAFLRQDKEEVDKFFADYESDRLRMLSRKMTEFMEKGDEDEYAKTI